MADIYDNDIGHLIEDCIRKNEKGQEILYKKFFGYALSVALLYVGDRNWAIETVNDSFMKVFADLKKFDTTKSFKAWLRKIVINTAIDRLRKSSRKISYMEELPSSTLSGDGGAISNLSAADIISMVNTLPQLHKMVFCLYDIEGYSHDEIAKQLRIPESSSRVYLARARKRLRELYEHNFNDL